MLRSLYSGISGMTVNQTKQDVIADNISNVGTTAFKAKRVRFSDMLSQNVSDAMAPTANSGGRNPSQVGLGAQIAGIDAIISQGNLNTTGRNLDFAIDDGTGNCYFMVAKGPDLFKDNSLNVNNSAGAHNVDTTSMTKSGTEILYTRDGAFSTDDNGDLVTTNGDRILGYSLTNDNSTISATNQSPNAVTAAGFSFQFGPGTQLNGYSVTLGNVGAGTVASATIDTTGKKIILSGDFSTANGIKSEQAQIAINKALGSAGISQEVAVTGSNTVINNIVSTNVTGGADAGAPGNVTVAGFTLQFNSGSALNGYSIQLGTVGAGTATTATVNETTKKITLNGDFVTTNAVSAAAVKNAINSALSSATPAPITQTVGSVTGNAISLSSIAATTDNNGSKPTVPSITSGGAPVTTILGCLDISANAGGQLNGYTIKINPAAAGTKASYTMSTTTPKSITISVDTTKGSAAIASDVQTQLTSALGSASITQPRITVTADATITVPDPSKTTVLIGSDGTNGTDGSDDKAPADITLGNLNFSFNNGTTFNGYKIQVGKIAVGTALNATVDPDNKTITIDGDFITPNAFTISDLQTELNSKISGCLNNGAAAGKIDYNTSTAGNAAGVKITVSGSPSIVNGVSSSAISGGSDLKAPDNITNLDGLNLQFTQGASLNGYTFQIGTITAGTKTSATVNTTNKIITINGDFTAANGTDATAIMTAINDALTSKGITQAVTVTGTPTTINNTQSNTSMGGTPVQSIDNDGIINFVDATKTIKSYDGNLKTLRIPKKVHDQATNTDLAITKITVTSDGTINAQLEDGRVAAIGQMAMATFKNPAGLSSIGDDLFQSTVNSGDAIVKTGAGTTGEDNSKGFGDVRQGKLEMSNVDLAAQFTDMIVTTRAFEASSKLITTGDELLQDIINIKR